MRAKAAILSVLATAFCLAAGCAEAGEPLTAAAVTIDADRPIRTIPRGIFGVNLEWTLLGSGLWDPAHGEHYADRLTRIKEIGVGSLRYPGGTLSDYFHWDQAIGEERVEQLNPFYRPDQAEKKTKYPHYGPAEYLRTVEALKAEPWITANVGTGTPDEAAAWARWCRDQGREVTHWEIGNEVYLKSDIPEGVTYTPPEYAARFNEFAVALKAVDPRYSVSAIGQMPAVGILAGSVAQEDWNRVVIEQCADRMDCLALHHAYAPVVMTGPDGKFRPEEKVYEAMLGASVFVRQTTDAILELIRTVAPERADAISLAVTEHEGLFYPMPGEDTLQQVRPNRTLASAIYLATLYNLFISEPKIRYAHKMTLITPVFGGVLSTTWEPGGDVWPNPQFHVCREYARCAEQQALTCEVDCGTYAVGAVGFVPDLPSVPYLDVSATSASDGTLSVFLVNRSLDRPLPVKLSLRGLSPSGIKATVLAGPRYDSTNDGPEDMPVSPTQVDIELADPIATQLPPCSLTVLALSP